MFLTESGKGRLTRILLGGLMLFASATTCAALIQDNTNQNAALSVDEVIARYVEARGGQAKLDALQSARAIRHVVYRPSNPGEPTQEYDEVYEWKRPNFARSEMKMTQGTYQIAVYAGERGWKTVATSPEVAELDAKALGAQPSFSDALESELVHYREKGYTVSMRDAQSQGKPCYGILTTRPDKSVMYRCIDKTTFLDVERRTATATMIASDFRAVNGIMFAFRFDTSSKEGTTVATTQSMETNIEFASADFEKPKALAKAENRRAPVEAAKVFGAPDAKQVRAAQAQLIDAIQHVRFCPALPFVPACSFASEPGEVKVTQKRIEFDGPVNKQWGGPKQLYIDLTAIPGLKPMPRETWRILNPEQMYTSFDPEPRKYDKQSTNVLFDRPRLEWPLNSPYVKRFMDALEVLKANAKAPTDAIDQESSGFKEAAEKWRALTEKPPLPEGVHREEVLAKYAITEDKNPEVALQHFEKGLAIEPLWPAGQLGAATICGELQRWECAVAHGERYLEMLPNGPQADVLRDKLIIWKDKLGKD